MNRKDLAWRLAQFEGPIGPTLSALAEYGWDCEEPLVKLDADSVRSVLTRYLSGSLTEIDVATWADAIECRDDIDVSKFRDVLFELASPEITRQLTASVATEILASIENVN